MAKRNASKPGIEGVANGRIVHYVMRDSDYGPNNCGTGHHRPAIIVEDWGNNKGDNPTPAVNLLVFVDGANDGHPHAGPQWVTSASYSEGAEPGTWHWPQQAHDAVPTADDAEAEGE